MTLLLWTERPVLLDREKETHEWMEKHRPWEAFGLELVYDNLPGSWIHYSHVFRETWAKARAEGVGFVNQESDIVPTMEAYQSLLECPEQVCTVPYVIYPYKTGGEPVGFSAVIVKRSAPPYGGGWDSKFAQPGDDWAQSCDLGLVKFGARLIAGLPCDDLPPLTMNAGSFLHTNLWGWLAEKFPESTLRRVHLHFPGGDGLRNHHKMWDAGDDEHHPGWGRPDWVPI